MSRSKRPATKDEPPNGKYSSYVMRPPSGSSSNAVEPGLHFSSIFGYNLRICRRLLCVLPSRPCDVEETTPRSTPVRAPSIHLHLLDFARTSLKTAGTVVAELVVDLGGVQGLGLAPEGVELPAVYEGDVAIAKGDV